MTGPGEPGRPAGSPSDRWEDGLVAIGTLAALWSPQHWVYPALFGLAAWTGLPALVAGAALAAWWGAASDPLGWVPLVVAIPLAARRRASLPVGLALLASLRQWAVRGELSAATDPSPQLVVLGTLAAGLWALGRRQRVGAGVRGALALLAAAGLWRDAAVLRATGLDRLHRAEQVQAARWVVPGLVSEDQRLDMDALVAVPGSDAAAAWIGWKRALGLGWRPAHPSRDVGAIARELDTTGRGGQARRLLRGYPRDGVVDFALAALERWHGEPDQWRGGVDPSAMLPCGGGRTLGWALLHDGSESVVFGLSAACDVRVVGRAESYNGDPSVAVRLDDAVLRWVPTGPLDLPSLAAGPHTLQVTFDTDEEGPGGDRNVFVDALATAPATRPPPPR